MQNKVLVHFVRSSHSALYQSASCKCIGQQFAKWYWCRHHRHSKNLESWWSEVGSMQNLSLSVPIQAANGKPYGYIRMLGPHHLIRDMFQLSTHHLLQKHKTQKHQRAPFCKWPYSIIGTHLDGFAAAGCSGYSWSIWPQYCSNLLRSTRTSKKPSSTSVWASIIAPNGIEKNIM